jgi:hypothetical protein
MFSEIVKIFTKSAEMIKIILGNNLEYFGAKKTSLTPDVFSI